MARRKSYLELEELAKIKRAQEAARKAARAANPKVYTPKKDEDYTEAYYLDPLDNNRVLKFKVPNSSITLWGGLPAAGLTAAAPAGKAIVEVTKGLKIPSIKIRWYFGDETAIVVPANAEHGRWVKFYDTKEGKSHHQIPYSVAATTVDLDQIYTSFFGKLNTAGEKERILGARGRAELVIGYGNMYVPLGRVGA